MTTTDLVELMEYNRKRTMNLLEAIGNRSDAKAALAWRPGPGRAHIAWQLMHLAATDDRHLNVRMTGGEPVSPENVRRFAGGSTPDDTIPSVDEIRQYMTQRRDALMAHLRGLSQEQLAQKPNDKADWTYAEWFRLLAWHEAHHQGQAHLTLNLYKASHDIDPTP